MFTGNFHSTNRVLEQCTYVLPKRSCSLQKFLAKPYSAPSGLPPNEVIASQSDCPAHVSLDEFKAFGALSLGCRIQWMNILIQLSSPSLDFTKEEINILLLQIIYQTGQPIEGNVRRVNHEVLAEEKFGLTLLIELRSALQRVKENWESSRALASFIHLAARLLSLTSSARIRDECLEYLTEAREVAFCWSNTLRNIAQQSTDDTHRTEFLSMVVEVMLICINTFDIDQNYLNIILACPSQVSPLIQCFIAIQECLHSTLGQCNQLQSIMLARWKTLLYRALPEITRQIVEMKSVCLNDAIQRSWSDYQAGSAWESVESPYGHWLAFQQNSATG